MPMPTASSLLSSPSHSTLHNVHVNVKAFGAVGDGVANDTSAINNAIAAAVGGSGLGVVYFPAGKYLITSTINLDFANAQGVRFEGGLSNNPGGTLRASTVTGTINGPLFQRSSSALGSATIIFENLTIWNQHATGTCIELRELSPSSGIRNCFISAYRGVNLLDATFSVGIISCKFTATGTAGTVGSWGVYCSNHAELYNVDFVGYDHGIRMSGLGHVVHGIRAEVCRVGIMLGMDNAGSASQVAGTSISGMYTEGVDTGIYLRSALSTNITGAHFNATAASPSGGSLFGIDIGGTTYATTIQNVTEGGSHATNFIREQFGGYNLTFISVYSNVAWNLLTTNVGLTVLNCTP